MRAFTVHAPPGDGAERPADPEKLAFVKDGICWPALLVPVVWIIWHRLWLTLVWYIVFALVVAWIGRLWNEDFATIVAVLGAILFALEANNIRRLSLNGRGWREAGGSFGKNLEEAEARYFGVPSHATGESRQPEPQPDRPAAIARAAYPDPERRDHSDEAIFGLFPQPER